MIPPLRYTIPRFDLCCVGFDMTEARLQITDAAHALGVHLFPHTLSKLRVRFKQETAGAPDSDLHAICGTLLGYELMREQDMHQPGCLKRLLAILEILEATAKDDRMNGRDTFDKPALELSPPDTNVPKVASGFYQ